MSSRKYVHNKKTSYLTTNQLKTEIGIIGGGFTGIILAVQIIRQSSQGLSITIVNENNQFGLGVAYNPYSKYHLLNVVAGKMSVFRDEPNHFVHWLIDQPEYHDTDEENLKTLFLPRHIYGRYLTDIWAKYKSAAKRKGVIINEIVGRVTQLKMNENEVEVALENNTKLHFHQCVLATGNQLPGNPNVTNISFFKSSNYFQNPWCIDSVLGLKETDDVLIVGNGLTMVDTVLGLLEQGFRGRIHSLSRHGYGILPHRESKVTFAIESVEKLTHMSLLELVQFVNFHRKQLRTKGISVEVIVDALRPHTQEIWRNFTINERRLFMLRFRHLWGVARHRIPLSIHDKIQQLRTENKLHILSGKIINFSECENLIRVTYIDKNGIINSLDVARVINCTGPESDLGKLDGHFLHSAFNYQIISQDELKLGISTDIKTYRVKKSDGNSYPNLYTIGTNLKGELWESTAVNELRGQTEHLAKRLTSG